MTSAPRDREADKAKGGTAERIPRGFPAAFPADAYEISRFYKPRTKEFISVWIASIKLLAAADIFPFHTTASR